MPKKKTSVPVDPSLPVPVAPVAATGAERVAKSRAKAKEKAERPDPSVGLADLAAALVQAINSTKAPVKKTAVTRVPRTPWTNRDGTPKSKLKRKMYQHGILIDQDMVTSAQIDLLNQLRPGRFLEGHVVVTRRRDRGVDFDYPVKTSSQRLKLVNQFGIRDLNELLQRCIEEAEHPEKYILPETLD